MKRMVAALFVIAALWAQSGEALQLAAESYETTADGAGGTYLNNVQFTGSGGNNAVVVGNTGFSAANVWNNTASLIVPRNNLASTSLTHNGVVGDTQTGLLLLTPENNAAARNNKRQLASTPPTVSTYYMSGLIRYSDLFSNDVVAVGLMNDIGTGASSFATGMHLGLVGTASGVQLTAMAGNTTNFLGSAFANTTYQIVLRLDVNSAGNDQLSAWYAADGDPALTTGLSDLSVATWSSSLDLRRLVQQYNSDGSRPGNTGNKGLAYVDEFRFGTEWNDVTAFAVPEPSTMLLMGAGLFLLQYVRRRRA